VSCCAPTETVSPAFKNDLGRIVVMRRFNHGDRVAAMPSLLAIAPFTTLLRRTERSRTGSEADEEVSPVSDRSPTFQSNLAWFDVLLLHDPTRRPLVNA